MRLPHSSVLLLTLATALTAQEQPASQKDVKPDPMVIAWQQALAAAKKHKAPLLVFVMSENGPVDEVKAAAHRAAEDAAGMFRGHTREALPIATRRDLFLRQVGLLRCKATYEQDVFTLVFQTPVTEVQRLFAVTVQAVVPAALCHAEPAETLVVLRADGQRLAGFEIDLTDCDAVVRAMTPFVLSREALAPRIANVDPELKKTLDHLRGLGIHPRSEDDQARIERSRERLRNHLPAVAPAFVGEPGIGLTIERDSFVCGLLDPAPPWGTAEEHRRPLLDDVCSSYVPPRFDAVLKLLGP